MIKTSHLLIGTGTVLGIFIGGKYLLSLKRLTHELQCDVKCSIHKVSLTGIELKVSVKLKNPSGGVIKLKHPFIKLMYEDKVIASSQIRNENVTIERYSEVDLDPIMFTLGFLSLATTVPKLIKEYRDTGKLQLTIDTITTINDSLPYNKTDLITLGGGKPA